MADPYSTLGVARGATDAEIKSAYRKLAKELHPDKNRDNPKAAEKFSAATNAYDLLSDKDKRARFDRGEIDADGNPTAPFGFGGGGGGGFRGQPGGFETGGADFGDIFEGLFGGAGRRAGGGFGRQAPQPRGANVAYRLAVQFADAAILAPQRITLQDGKTIDLKLPAGVESGTQMRLSGKGQQGLGGAGDAIVTIEVRPHPFFTRDGDNVRLDLPVTLDEAVKGGKVKVPTVDGPVMLGVPAGTTSGKTLRLRGKGFTGKDGTRGDQLVTLMVDVPADDPAIQALVEKWQDRRAVRAHLGV
ncbi:MULTISPECIES: DnaJ C-terminal domain-containing protein [unclassified Sphingobium]|uniref:DnaJ C-terminal domain-containing protein n=1 Tax=unclassified Sphingobium TaxID=2611147 RepID=UPI000D172FC6|nr:MULTISPECIES: DnaJ C-terminal domain-containing protein [unclassified Sphingobium]MBG6118718.1 DnaJ-class molecular chaperone [Sphingobium sp. JAI105]PSO13758.1 molecular chaperone DnaJ [Sphingobium sp. AEW4]TWD10597.1 DnaJ-like protein [Sphingobium sp. AEW010]TWD27998.1 DnaJ-like protein [Sphingobium sp. AEW013]TWD28931.1 DnaJ-like protein [Sphingobium sp. AEW001]